MCLSVRRLDCHMELGTLGDETLNDLGSLHLS
jgi:hypothetical protein